MPIRSIESTETDPVLSYGPSELIGCSKSVDFAEFRLFVCLLNRQSP